MSNHPVLSRDERAFLQKLLGETPQMPGVSRSFRIDGGEAGNALLERLAMHSSLTLESQAENYRLSFPLELQEDEFHSLQISLGTPRIFEHGPTQRPWRVHLDPAPALLDANGAATHLHVLEMSPSGLLLDLGEGHMPERFSLWLALPDQEPIPIRGSLARITMPGVAAYRIELRHNRHAERLRRFIFRQHRLQHPELDSAVPAENDGHPDA